MDNALAATNTKKKSSKLEDEFDSCTDDKVCVYDTAISGGYIKQEPYDTELGNIQTYVSIKEDKLCVYESVINRGYLKQDPCDTKPLPRNVHNYTTIKDEIIEDLTVVLQETGCTTNIKLSYLTCCEECGEEYDLYCLKCPMLIRIFDGNNSDLSDNGVMRTLPKNFVDIFETQSGVGVVAVRVIPKGVVFGPFGGLDLTKDEAVSQWIPRNKELVYTKNPKWSNWMQYIRRVDRCSHPNLIPFQYEDGLYYQSDRHISVGGELLVCCDSDSEESATLDSCFKPRICDSLDDAYACTLCCVGYKSICYLAAHNSRCPEKRDQNDFCKEIIQCAFCKIYMDKKEYSDCHVDQCFERNTKIFAMRQERKHPVSIYKCNKCVFETTAALDFELHLATHEDAKPYPCDACGKQFRSKGSLLVHIKILHNQKKNKYKCRKCDFVTVYGGSMKEHLLSIHRGIKRFKCPRCAFRACQRKTFDRHLRDHKEAKPIKCETCDIEFAKIQLFVGHQEKVHALANKAYRFACTHCPYKTTTNWNLERHVAIHNDDKPFECSLCSYKTMANSNLKRHIATHSDDKPFACSLCSYTTRTNSQLKRHIATHSDDKPFACSLCSHKTRTKLQLKRHIVIHNDDKPFACLLCSYKTMTNSQLKRHIVTHNDNKPFACIHCSYKARTTSHLKRHIAIHDKDKPFACSLCPYKTRTTSHLKRHIATHNDDKPFACSLCSYKTTANSKLKEHIVIHNDDKPFACIHCPYKTKTNSLLKLHIATHNDDKPFACSLCFYKSRTNSNLKRHIATHNDDKPFACSLCSYKTRTNWQLKLHIATHNDDKPFACSLCSYKTTTNSKLRVHMVVHDNDKPFACTLCPYRTKLNSNLKRHLAIHNDDNPSRFMRTEGSHRTKTNPKLKQYTADRNDDKL